MKQKTIEQKINGWLPQDPSEFKVTVNKPMLRSISTVGDRKLRVSFVSLGLLFWVFASFLLSFTQLRMGMDGDHTFIVMNNYWIEIVVLFASGIALVSFASVYKKTKEIKKKGIALIVLATSILAILQFLILAIPMVALHFQIYAYPTFSYVIMFDVLIVSLYFFAIFQITHYTPWNKLKPKNLRH